MTPFTLSKTLSHTDIIGELDRFAPHSRHACLSTLMAVNRGTHILNMGRAGQGKSHCTTGLLTHMGMDHGLINGHKSPTKVFDMLTELYPSGILVIDEAASIFYNRESRNLLLSALFDGRVTWQDEMRVAPNTILFNVNDMPKDKIMGAVADRCVINMFDLTESQVADKIASKYEYQPEFKVFKWLKDNIRKQHKLDDYDKRFIMNYVGFYKPKSVRFGSYIENAIRFSKGVFGGYEVAEEMLNGH